ETKRRCLEPFFTTKGERGTGLGLAMVYGTVQRHNATIEVESAPGEGTAMRLLFPTPSAAPETSIPQADSAHPPVPLHLLVIDDDLVLLRSLGDTLREDGHNVVTAAGGQAGIDLFQQMHPQQPFAAVITDLGMPGVDGRAVA